MKINLNNVTICAVDSITPELAARAIIKSSEHIDFAQKILFTHAEIFGEFETIKIPKINSKEDYSEFLIKKMNPYIETDFVLIVQWDGYVIYPQYWDDNFLNYDYIGAKWPWYEEGFNMGNGGFSLRSKKLLRLIANDDFIFIPKINEDELICRINREHLQSAGISYATIDIADKFSYERSKPHNFTFGFHGLFNLWRHEPDSFVLESVKHLNPSTFLSREYIELTTQYFLLEKFDIFVTLRQNTINYCNIKDVASLYLKFLENVDLTNKIITFQSSIIT